MKSKYLQILIVVLLVIMVVSLMEMTRTIKNQNIVISRLRWRVNNIEIVINQPAEFKPEKTHKNQQLFVSGY